MGASSTSSNQKTMTTLAEINVTPLVDVMLVLLIIFMISAPLMQQGVQVDLPKANAGSLSEAPEELLLVVDSKQRISINGKIIKKGTLHTKLSGISKVKPKVQVFVQADRRVPYGFVAKVIASVKEANISRVGLVTVPTKKKARL